MAAGPDLLATLWRAEQPPRWSAREWEHLLGQARVTRLLARVALLFQRPGWREVVPPACRPHLDNALLQADHLGHDVLWEAGEIIALLRRLPTPVVLLKGAAYVAAGLPPGRGRLFSDIDILVGKPQLRDVERALAAGGWLPEKLEPYDDRYYRQWMHELPPLQHVLRQTFLDVHHTIAPPTSRYVIDGAQLLQRAIPLRSEPRLAVLAPTDMVLHSALHLMTDGDLGAGQRDLLDLSELLRHFGADPDFWSELVARSRELGLQKPLAQALRQVERLFGPPWSGGPGGAPALLASPASRFGALTLMLTLALRPVHPSCDTPAAGVARWLLYVRSHWLRMHWYQIAPHLLRKAWARMVKRYGKKAAPAARDHQPPPTSGRG